MVAGISGAPANMHDISIIMRVNVHSHKSMNTKHYNECEQVSCRLWQFACSACFLCYTTLPFKWPGYSMPRRLNTFSSLKLLFIFQSTNETIRPLQNLINLMSVCLIVRFIFFSFFDSITNVVCGRCAALSTENTMRSKGKMVSLMLFLFFFFSFSSCIFNFEFQFCCRRAKETVRIFCWLDQHEQSTHSFEWLMTMEYEVAGDHVGKTNESCFDFLYLPNLLDQSIDGGHSIMLNTIQVLVRISFVSFAFWLSTQTCASLANPTRKGSHNRWSRK